MQSGRTFVPSLAVVVWVHFVTIGHSGLAHAAEAAPAAKPAEVAKPAEAAKPADGARPADGAKATTPEKTAEAEAEAKKAAAEEEAARREYEAAKAADLAKPPSGLKPNKACGVKPLPEAPPLVKTAAYDKAEWDKKSYVATALLKGGHFMWSNLKDCERYNVTTRIIVFNAPKSSDMKFWLGIVANAAEMLRGPLLEDEVDALQKIGKNGRWFARPMKNGVSMEFPMAMEHVRLSATIVDGEDLSILTLVQEST